MPQLLEFHDVEQNSEEWLQLRAGKITSSALGKIMARDGQAFGDPAKDYAVQICLERMLGHPVGGGFTSAHMERGHEQEPLARMAYEDLTFSEVTGGGFFDLGDVGCSPDGLVYDDGLIEIKSVIPSVHYSNIVRGSYDPAYKWQLFGNLKFTGREWIDFVSYCAEFPDDKKIYVCRLYRDHLQAEFERIDARLEQFRALIKKTQDLILSSRYSVNTNHIIQRVA